MVRRCQNIQSGHYAAVFVGHASQPEPQFDSTQRSGKHEVIEAAEVTDAKHFTRELAQTRSEGHVEILENDFPQLIGTVAFRCKDPSQGT